MSLISCILLTWTDGEAPPTDWSGDPVTPSLTPRLFMYCSMEEYWRGEEKESAMNDR